MIFERVSIGAGKWNGEGGTALIVLRDGMTDETGAVCCSAHERKLPRDSTDGSPRSSRFMTVATTGWLEQPHKTNEIRRNPAGFRSSTLPLNFAQFVFTGSSGHRK